MLAKWHAVAAWRRRLTYIEVSALLLVSALLALDGNLGVAAIVAGYATTCIALIVMVFRVHRPGDGRLLDESRGEAGALDVIDHHH
jgi:small-conductance mechanosensitive channel